MLDLRGGVLDSECGNETIGYENLGRRGSGPYPMEVDPEVYGARNANCYPMQKTRPAVISRRRGHRDGGLTARFMGAGGNALGMVGHCARAHLRFRQGLQASGHSFHRWGHRHGMTRLDIHTRVRTCHAGATVRTYVHAGGHRRGCILV